MLLRIAIEINEEDVCYYRKAYSPEVFDMLSIDEKHSLIAFTVEEFSNDVVVAYSDKLCNEIGVWTEQDVLLINSNMLLKSSKTYSLELYLFLYSVLMKRFIARKKNFVPVIEESYINRKWRKKDYKSHTLDIIILHLMLDELLEMNEVVLVNDEDRKHFLGEVEKISHQLSQTQDIVETARIDIPQEQPSIAETNKVQLGRGR